MNRFLFHLLAILASVAPLLSARAQTPAAEWATACADGPVTYPWGSSGPAEYPYGPTNVAIDGVGNVYVLGSFTGTVTIGSTTLSAMQTYPGYVRPSDYYLAKLNAQGQHQWAIQLGDGQSVQANQVAADNAGNIYLTGSFTSYSMQVGAGGPTLYNSSNNGEGFVARFSGQTGQCQWARRFGGTGADGGSVLALNTAGEVLLSGFTGDGAADLGSTTLPAAPAYGTHSFLAKLAPSSNWMWARQIGSNGRASVNGLAMDNQENVYLSGYFDAPSIMLGTTLLTSPVTASCSFSRDVFFAKYTSAGAFKWAVQGDATGRNDTYGGKLSYDGQGRLYTAGSFDSQRLKLGSFTLNNASQVVPPPVGPAPPIPCADRYYTDAYVACLDTAGTWQWATRRGGPDTDGATLSGIDGAGQLVVFLKLAGSNTLAKLDKSVGIWTIDYALPFPMQLTSDLLGRLYCAGTFTGSSLNFGGQHIPGAGNTGSTGFVARLGPLPLAVSPVATTNPGLQAWPSPGPGTGVWVQGAPAGQTVAVFDVLGRQVGGGAMPTSGPLRLSWAGAGLAPGVYVVRSGGQSGRWVVES